MPIGIETSVKLIGIFDYPSAMEMIFVKIIRDKIKVFDLDILSSLLAIAAN